MVRTEEIRYVDDVGGHRNTMELMEITGRMRTLWQNRNGEDYIEEGERNRQMNIRDNTAIEGRRRLFLVREE